MHRIQIFVREKSKQHTNNGGRDSGWLFSKRRKREDTADDDDVQVPVLLHRVGALEVELNQFVVVHNRCNGRGLCEHLIG